LKECGELPGDGKSSTIIAVKRKKKHRNGKKRKNSSRCG
jgi:hypothetical protein